MCWIRQNSGMDVYIYMPVRVILAYQKFGSSTSITSL